MEQKPKEETEWEARERLGEKPFDKPKWEEELQKNFWIEDDGIKDFIASLLQRQKEELVKEILDWGLSPNGYDSEEGKAVRDYLHYFCKEKGIKLIQDLEV